MMPRLLVALMIAALSTDVYTTSIFKSTYYNEDQAILKALRESSHVSLPTSAKTSGNSPGEKVYGADGKFPLTAWWMSELILPQTVKKRQDVSSYNLNSFGLRYGK
ncbi:metastasis-suppressor KiSS-1 [Centropristis striata]|uniref:metastasis-suppressor KiSS-1 n=1 Tax=Centropristis striata TaxID=184440 RepID=UPI0027E193E5|nr:metastasis-suppressor KiSS-1 [Centropristis striata]XP_059185709.1 metastasis-suppressor KiSS-1 [Centropristis striata]